MSPTGIFWTGWAACSPTRSACCSTPTIRPIGSILGRRRSMKCLDLLNERRHQARGNRAAGGMAEDLVAGRDHRLGLPVFHAQGTAGPRLARRSAAPRNSYELAFRNQFFTPRYVVEFLTDNTLGRIWYEMRKGDTKLKDQCRYMVRRPTEIFLKEGEQPPKDAAEGAGRSFAGRTAQAAGPHPASPEERPTGTEDSRPGLRQRPLPAVLLRPAADDLRGSLRRPRPRPGTPEGLPDAGRLAGGMFLD